MSSTPVSSRPRRRWSIIVAGIVAISVVAFVVGRMMLLVTKSRPATGDPVPVIVDAAVKRDVPIYVSGIGTVQAVNTVTVKVRVDGEIQRISFVEGQDVSAGALLAQIDPRPYQAQLAIVEANRARDEAQLANARRDLGRVRDLVERGFTSRQSVDGLLAAVDQSEAAVRGDQAQIDAAKLQLTYTSITAPISGRTGVRLVDQGNLVRASDNTGLVVITQIDPVSVVFTLPEESLDAINRAVAVSAPLKVFAYGRGESRAPRGQGTLLLINNQIDQASGTIQLKATFPNPEHQLWPGQFVNVSILLDTRREAISVPAAGIETGPTGQFVYVVKKDRTVEVRPVKVTQMRDGVALVDSGLADGEFVVVNGQYKLTAGARVAEQRAGGAPARRVP